MNRNFRKIMILLTWVFIIAYLVTSPFLIKEKVENITCDTLEISIINDIDGHYFITRNEIERSLKSKGIQITGNQIESLNVTEIEKVLANNPLIEKADVYVSVKGTVEIDITQRIPLFRVMNSRNQDFYIDTDGYYMPLSSNYTSHVMVITGHFRKPAGKVSEAGIKIYEIVRFIESTDLWSSQIEQIHISSNGDLELIPRVGGHRIIFGQPESYEKKFKKLYALYEQGLKVYGWNIYKKIDLSYENQVVCTKI